MFSPFLLVRQKFESRKIADIPAAVREQLQASGFAQRVKPGAKIAIGVGSRGIANIDVIAAAAVNWWKDQGMKPFLFPAMGSHGAASAKGQAAVLAKYGITESSMGCPVKSALAVVDLGATPEGIQCYLDKAAYSSGGIMLLGRVKWHTDFAGKMESGLFKMMAIGLGKFAGAKRYHTYAFKMGLENMIRSVGRQVLKSGKILGGIAILEDGNHDTAQLTAVRVEEMETREEELLALVKSWMARIPVEHLDILILNEIGKIFSGAGMDTKVVNRGVNGEYNPWPNAPRIERIFLRDLNPMSYGNAVGIGMADVVHDRLLKKMKKKPTYVNSITASTPSAIRVPAHFGSDRKCLEEFWPTVGKFDPKDIEICWIRNSQDLGLMAMTENLRPAIEANPNLEILGGARELEFDAQGNLRDWLAE
ncbi:MAG: hypothetical protein IT161_17315 [Bryobacterales bacterium]|nr:hypothetical protein [Bryobacterales bacterium]